MKILKKLEKLTEFINKENILYNEKMSRHTTFKIGGEADVIVTPEKEEEIIDVIYKEYMDNRITENIVYNTIFLFYTTCVTINMYKIADRSANKIYGGTKNG